MEKKTFSVKDGTLETKNNHVELYEIAIDDYKLVASTSIGACECYNAYYIPSTLTRNPKTDEELAEEKYPYVGNDLESASNIYKTWQRDAFLAVRKSVGGEFHLTREQLVDFAYQCSLRGYHSVGDMIFNVDDIITPLTPSIYPTSIEVDFDGTNYIWETLKAYYE